MKIRLTNGIIIGILVGIVTWNITIGLLVGAFIETLSATLIFLAWLYRGYRPIEQYSFLASLVNPNTSPDSFDLSYKDVLVRIVARVIFLVSIVYYPHLLLVAALGLTITFIYK